MGISHFGKKIIGAAKNKIDEYVDNTNPSGVTTHGHVEPVVQEIQGTPFKIQIYTHNIRQDAKNRMENEEPWSKRKEGVIDILQKQSQELPTLVGLQEVKHNQLQDILNGLGREWSYYGVGRDDGYTKGEYSPILFKSTEWSFLAGRTLWLSETPNTPSKGWDAALPRIVTIATLRSLSSGKVVNMMNTHYDHKGKRARIKSSQQLVKLMNGQQGISILCGDFNSQKHEEAYQTLSKYLVDACNCKERKGFEHTNTGFEKGREESTIDFIWVPQHIPILRYEVLSHVHDGCLCSDHRPVTAVVEV